MEEKIIIVLQSIGNKYLDVFFQGVSYLVSWIGAIFLFLIIILFVNKKYGITFGLGFLTTISFNYLLKVIINRPRPFEANSQIINKLSTIGKSFPSGHMVSCTFIVLSILFLFFILRKNRKHKLFNNPIFKVMAYVCAGVLVILTAIARMYLGQHYITDLIGGLLVAVIGFVATYFIYKKIEKKQNKC